MGDDELMKTWDRDGEWRLNDHNACLACAGG